MMGRKAKKLNGTVIVTYRCNARCTMCNRYKAPSRPEEEITLDAIRKLPKMYFTNITGGEPFIRRDLSDIVRELYKKSDRIVISTNGFFTDRIISLAKEFPHVGIRISIEGLQNEVATYDGYQRQRLLVKPGLTCYWQTRRNRDSITFDEWVDLDLLYIKKCSAWSDLKLIIQTVGVVLTAQGS